MAGTSTSQHRPALDAAAAGVGTVEQFRRAVLWAALARLENIDYFGQLAGHTHHTAYGGAVETHVLRFHASVNGHPVEGIDVIELDADGLIAALTVLLRPVESVLATTFTPRRHRIRS